MPDPSPIVKAASAATTTRPHEDRIIPFAKMHGLGNDYVYLDDQQLTDGMGPGVPAERGDPRGGADSAADSAADWARALADRHRGVGGDGLIILRRDSNHPCRMEMYNADGSRAEMCGNGLRCVARLAFERGYSAGKTEFAINTDHGPRQIRIALDDSGEVAGITVAMGAAQVGPPIELSTPHGRYRGIEVDVGNPHFVIETETPVAEIPLATWGPPLESHSHFPRRANIEFVRVRSHSEIDFRVWERGSGETRACGTGATAAVAALHSVGRVAATCTVHLRGGDLSIEVVATDSFMTGPATLVFEGNLSLNWLQQELQDLENVPR